jgi:hypothetical protein
MEFIKAHYEKVILSVVLLGLAAAAALMPMKVSAEKQREDERKMTLIRPKVVPLPPIILTNSLETLTRLQQSTRVKLGGDHNVFNPVRWQRRQDGGLMKGSEAGLNALKITAIRPLALRISYDGTSGEPGNLRYQISITKDTERGGRPWPRLAAPKEKNSVFTLEEVRGDPANPSELVLLLAGEKELIVISKEKPYERIIGYAADFRHEFDKRNWQNLKVKDELTFGGFGGETYNIVAITENEVVLSAKSNKKQTTIEYRTPQR